MRYIKILGDGELAREGDSGHAENTRLEMPVSRTWVVSGGEFFRK
jgi:hypothetical protein